MIARMTPKLFTIGFTQKTAEEFFRLLQEAQVQTVIDIRENRGGQLSGFAKHPDLAYFLSRLLGVEYLHEPLFAPTPEIRQAYRATRDWPQYEKSFLELMEQRKVFEHVGLSRFEGRVALLCSEPKPDKCHRRLVADLLVEQWHAKGKDGEIHHLLIERPKKRRTRKTMRHEGAGPL